MKIDDRLQAHLDGEIDLEALPEELRSEAESWARLLADVRETAPAGAPAGLEHRVLSAISDRRGRPAWIDWLIRPRPISVSPAAAVLATAALVTILLLPLGRESADVQADRQVYVQFVVDAPAAETVHLVGDFNEWQPTVALEDPDGDGVWSGRVPLHPGVHEYMFVIDGSAWVTDPNASSYQEDGFGQRNALVAVSPVNGT